jgi:HSP20 family protein
MITRWSDIDRMFEAMGLLRGRLDSMYDDFDRSFAVDRGWGLTGNYPRTNMFDKGDHLELTAEIPGVAKSDLTIKIQGNYLEISGTRNASVPEGYSVHRRERGTTSFTRSFSLPSDIDAGKVTATLSDGILLLKLPKAEAAKPRQITIN